MKNSCIGLPKSSNLGHTGYLTLFQNGKVQAWLKGGEGILLTLKFNKRYMISGLKSVPCQLMQEMGETLSKSANESLLRSIGQ